MSDIPASVRLGKPAYGRVSILGWAHFLNDGAANYLPGILPAILISMGLSASLAGALMAALLIGQALQPLTGLLSDRIGGKSLTVIGLAGSSIGGGLIAFAPNLGTLVVILILLGSANAFFHPQTLAAVRQASGDRHGTGMSIFMTGGEFGRGVWPLVASALVTVGGLGSIWVLGIPGLLTLPFLWSAASRLPARRQGAAKVRWRQHMKPLSLLVLFSSLRGVMLYSISAYVPVLWHAKGGSLNTGAAFITVFLVVGIIGNLTGGRLGDRIGRRRIVAVGMTVAVLSMVAFLLLGGAWQWVTIALAGIGLFATFPLTVLIGQDIVPENRSFGSGMALGLSNALGAMGVMALGPLAGAVSIPAVLWAGVICGLVAIPVLGVLPKGD